jgi:hypothetical protein
MVRWISIPAVVALMVGLTILIACAAPPPPPRQPIKHTVSEQDLRNHLEGLQKIRSSHEWNEERLRASASKKLRDPYSMWLASGAVLVRTQDGASKALCGRYNARNGFGAYVGERDYVMIAARDGDIFSVPGDPLFQTVYDRICGGEALMKNALALVFWE